MSLGCDRCSLSCCMWRVFVGDGCLKRGSGEGMGKR